MIRPLSTRLWAPQADDVPEAVAGGVAAARRENAHIIIIRLDGSRSRHLCLRRP